MTDIAFGFVGTGFIADVLARSVAAAGNARLAAVSSRSIDTARAFVADRPGVEPVEGVEALLARRDVDAVYVATPTAAKQPIALAAVAAGKHVLIDKPLADAEGLRRLVRAAEDRGRLVMDATHFVHHPRTAAVRQAIAGRIGTPKSLHAAFYFPFSDRTNIRFDPDREPMGAIGDMAWYAMRAIVEYLRPPLPAARVAVSAERDGATGAVVRASGLLAFAGGSAATFDVGYTADTAIMDLAVTGTAGLITMDDFVLDWTDSFAFRNADVPAGYVHRTGMAARDAFTFVETPSPKPADVLMIERFAGIAAADDAAARSAAASTALETQMLLDAVWRAAAADEGDAAAPGAAV